MIVNIIAAYMFVLSLLVSTCGAVENNMYYSPPIVDQTTGVALEGAAPASDTRAVIAGFVGKLPPNKVVAFSGLSNLKGDNTELSSTVFHETEPLFVAVCQEMGKKMIERNDLKLILDEWKLEMTGITGSDKGARELLGADIVITGTVTVKFTRVYTYFKAISLEDGAILASVETWQPAHNYNDPERNNLALVSSEAPSKSDTNLATSSDGNIKLWTETGDYAVGEKLRVFFEVSEPTFVTLIDVTPDGEKTVVFPNNYQKNNYCTPGKTYQIPPGGAPFFLEVTGPPGKDRLIALSSAKPEVEPSVVRTRGIKFTEAIVKATDSRATIALDIR